MIPPPSSGHRLAAFVQPLGDAAAIVSWPDVDDENVALLVKRMATYVECRWPQQFECLVPGFASLTLHYDPLRQSWTDVRTLINEAMLQLSEVPEPPARVVTIPVCYEPEFSVDLPELSAAHQMTIESVIRLHSEAEYTVRMIGFSPGFPYLAGLPECLATPRRSTPRLTVLTGSVAIGGRQTGIYSLESPGGWHIIGRTPVRMFTPETNPPCLLAAGDHVHFTPINRDEFLELQERP